MNCNNAMKESFINNHNNHNNHYINNDNTTVGHTGHVNKGFTFCNNCGKGGHLYHQCKMPITSIGVITVRSSTAGLEYLLVRRKDTLGYIDFLRGKYNISSKFHIMNLLNEMTIDEKKNLTTFTFTDLWGKLWGDTVGIQYRNEEHSSKDKFMTLKTGVMMNGEVYNLEQLISESTTNWKEAEWGFPKGRRNFQERDYDCAIREWEEETGYSRDNIKIVNNLLPYEETFTGSNYKSYRHKYYLSIFFGDNTVEPTHYQRCEIGAAKWMSYNECIEHIRDYNLEKIEMFNKVNKVITNYRIY
jgi:ADP-ribose pyrophosphatase YjhB (NUDIX family)